MKMTKAAPGDSTIELAKAFDDPSVLLRHDGDRLMTIRIASATMTTRTMVEVSIMVYPSSWLVARTLRSRKAPLAGPPDRD